MISNRRVFGMIFLFKLKKNKTALAIQRATFENDNYFGYFAPILFLLYVFSF